MLVWIERQWIGSKTQWREKLASLAFDRVGEGLRIAAFAGQIARLPETESQEGMSTWGKNIV